MIEKYRLGLDVASIDHIMNIFDIPMHERKSYLKQLHIMEHAFLKVSQYD